MSRTPHPQTPTEAGLKMSHRQVLQALSGLLLGMFVSMLATTVVGTALPLIISDLGGNQSAFTWVITATLLTTTVSTPVWGKLADLYNRKFLFQLALVIFVVSSAVAGFAQDPGLLIAMRAVQGIGAGGLGALSQIIMADILSPRDRGRYAGLFGGVMAVATIGGPLLGGVITDLLNWRWNFFVGLPFAVIGLVILQRTLHLPTLQQRKVKIDYAGIIFITSGVSLLLIWISLGGDNFAWNSVTSYVLAGLAALLLVVAVLVERRAEEPLIPLTLFKDRTFTLSVVASMSVGVALFGTSVFFSQYMQLARGATPTVSGLLTLPMMLGFLASSTIVGLVISRSGWWKKYVVSGAVIMLIGAALLGRLKYDTPLWQVETYMLILGVGVGMLMQNLVIVVQNRAEVRHMGVATSSVTFFRTLGGTLGVSAMGMILGTYVAQQLGIQIAQLPASQQAEAVSLLGSGTLPQISELPAHLVTMVESVYGAGVGRVFLAAVPLVLVTLVAVVFLPNTRLGTLTAVQRAVVETEGAAVVDAAQALVDQEADLAAPGEPVSAPTSSAKVR